MVQVIEILSYGRQRLSILHNKYYVDDLLSQGATASEAMVFT